MPEVLKNVDIIFISIDDSYKLLNKVKETKSIYEIISLTKKFEDATQKVE
jgi:hypothetical protein